MMLLWGPMLILITFGSIACVVAVVLAIARVKNPGVWKALVGGPLGCAVLPIALLLLLFLVVTLWGAVRPASGIYAQVLGREPTSAITNLRAKIGGGMDHSHALLAFDRTPAALATVQVGPLEPEPASALVWSVTGDGQAPDWWQPALDCPRRTERFARDHNDWDDIAVIECPTLARIFVLASNID